MFVFFSYNNENDIIRIEEQEKVNYMYSMR